MNEKKVGRPASRMGRYLLYAIGEIILVVIGILIALQINNWNEENKSDREMKAIYQSIVDELESDIKTLDETLPDYAWKNKIIKKIIKSNPSEKEWVENDSFFYSFVSTYDFEIAENRVQALKSKTSDNVEANELTNLIIDFYNKQLIDFKVKTEEHTKSFNRNVSYWEENTEWFGDAYTGDRTKLGVYVQDNNLFRNKLVWYGIVLRRLEAAMRTYKDEATKIKEIIKDYIKNDKVLSKN